MEQNYYYMDNYNEYEIVGSKFKYNILNEEKKLISNIWFDKIYYKEANNSAIVMVFYDERGYGYNFINLNTSKFIFREWASPGVYFIGNIYGLRFRDGWRIMTASGTDLHNDVYGDIFYLNMSRAILRKNRKFNIMNQHGSILSDIWFDYMDLYNFGICRVTINSKGWNYVNSNGILLLNKWFPHAREFGLDGYGIVSNNNLEEYKVCESGDIMYYKD